MGGFRTPARAKTRDLRWPASGNLHHVGRRHTVVDFPKADKASRGLVGRDGWKTAVHSARFERQRRANNRHSSTKSSVFNRDLGGSHSLRLRAASDAP